MEDKFQIEKLDKIILKKIWMKKSKGKGRFCYGDPKSIPSEVSVIYGYLSVIRLIGQRDNNTIVSDF